MTAAQLEEMEELESEGTGERKDRIESLLFQHAQKSGLVWPPKELPSNISLSELISRCPFLMAPMAGVSDAAWRLMAYAGGAPLAYSEMISAAGLHFDSERTFALALPHPAEPRLAVQLFGSKPELFKEAVFRLSEKMGDKLFLIDINMACPVPKVTKRGEGSALLDKPHLAAEILRACKSETNRPVTVKIRLGRRPDAYLAPDFARAMQDAGADAIAIHGRFASELYRGSARWEPIDAIAQSLSIPVIGSGDVMSPELATTRLAHTAVSAVFIARGSYGNPWIFRDSVACSRKLLDQKADQELQQKSNQGSDELLNQEPHHEPNQTPAPGSVGTRSFTSRLAAFRLHLLLLAATGAHMARARALSNFYLKGTFEAKELRARAMRCQKLQDYLELIDSILSA